MVTSTIVISSQMIPHKIAASSEFYLSFLKTFSLKTRLIYQLVIYWCETGRFTSLGKSLSSSTNFSSYNNVNWDGNK